MTTDFSAKWNHKIKAAENYFTQWESKFLCRRLEQYLEGFQRDGDDSYQSFVLNLFESTFGIKEATLLFKVPIFYVDPQPISGDFNPSKTYEWASDATDLLNSIASGKETGLAEALEMALIDAVSYFGIVEVQFKTEWQTNPAKGIPITELSEESGEEVEVGTEPEKIVTKEWFEVKRVPAHRFRVGGNDCATLDKCDWVGYYDFVRISSLRKLTGIKNLDRVTFAGSHSDEYQSEYTNIDDQVQLSGDLIKIWKVWDNLTHTFHIFTEGECVELFSESFTRLPLFGLRLKRRRRGWYPVPYSFSWKHPQDEINESREQLRAARRRAKRMWTMKPGAMEEDERAKIEHGPDGTIAIARTDNPLSPVQYPPLDASIGSVLQLSKDDFNIVSSTSAEARGQSDRTTATQASIIDQRATIRDNRERETIAQFLGEIGSEILKQFLEKSTLEFMIKVSHDVGSFFQDVPEIENKWREISSEDFGNIDYLVRVTVESLSPVANDQEKRKFMEFLAVISQYPIISSHPDLIMEAAFKVGYKNLKVVKAFQQAAVLQMLGQVNEVQGQGNPSDNMAQQTTQQMIPPTQTQIDNQLDATGIPQ